MEIRELIEQIDAQHYAVKYLDRPIENIDQFLTELLESLNCLEDAMENYNCDYCDEKQNTIDELESKVSELECKVEDLESEIENNKEVVDDLITDGKVLSLVNRMSP